MVRKASSDFWKATYKFRTLRFLYSRATKEKHSELQAHRAKKSTVTPSFSLQFLNVLYMADICGKFEKKSG